MSKVNSRSKYAPKVTLMQDLDTEVWLYQTHRDWTFSLDDDKSRQFGIAYEILNMSEATGDPEFKEYPWIVSASLVAHKVHNSFNEADPGYKPDLNSLRWDCLRYMGGVPVDHILANLVKIGDEGQGNAFELLAKQFNVFQATVKTVKSQFGTYAAQNGQGAQHSYLQFRTVDDAECFVKMLSKRAQIMQTMIGFTLDKPINLMGETGWQTMAKQVKGCK